MSTSTKRAFPEIASDTYESPPNKRQALENKADNGSPNDCDIPSSDRDSDMNSIECDFSDVEPLIDESTPQTSTSPHCDNVNNVTNGLTTQGPTHKTPIPPAPCSGLIPKTPLKRSSASNSPSNKRNTSTLGSSSSSSQSEYFTCVSDVSSCDDRKCDRENSSIVNGRKRQHSSTTVNENNSNVSSKSSSKVNGLGSINNTSKRNCDKLRDGSGSFESSRANEKIITVSEKVSIREPCSYLSLRIYFHLWNVILSRSDYLITLILYSLIIFWFILIHCYNER